MTEHRGDGNYHANLDATLFEEFRLLADSVLARVEPMLVGFAEGQQRAERKSRSSGEPSAGNGCNRCPICALAAAVRGERHELLVVLAEHAAAVPAMLREFLAEIPGGRCGGPANRPGGGQDGAASTPDGAARHPRRSAFVPINVTVQR